MLRSLTIRNFVIVESLDVELDAGFTVLTGETGAGKSILLDALGLLLGDRFEQRQLRPGAERAELSAVFDIGHLRDVRAWLAAEALDTDGDLLLRRVNDAQGRSRAWINGHPATIAQLATLGAQLLDLHGQHAHQALSGAEAQRELLDEFGGTGGLARDVALAWRAWRDAVTRRDAAAAAAEATARERDDVRERHRELAALELGADEWNELTASQRRLANAAGLIDATTEAERVLTDDDDALSRRLARIIQRLRQASADDPALSEPTSLLEPAAIQLDEASRALREYRRRLDLDPDELARVEQRLSAIHDLARKHRVKPEALHALTETLARRLAELSEAADARALAEAAGEAANHYDALAAALTAKRTAAAKTLTRRVTATMKELAMTGGRFEAALEPLPEPARFGRESVVFRIATHPRQEPGPLSRVASGGELSRVALAVHVAASEVGNVPTLVFDEVDTGIGGAVAATVGRMLQVLGTRRQVLCVTHLPQVAAHADHQFRVSKSGDRMQVTTALASVDGDARVDELARMLAGSEITTKTRAHARELFERHRRKDATLGTEQ